MTLTLPTLEDLEIAPPDISQLEIEDGQPVDSIHSERGQRLLSEAPYVGWEGPGEGRTFVVHTNVGIFSSTSEPPIVPDVLLSLDVKLPGRRTEKRHLTYFIWEYGKYPDVVIEIVSNRKGGELTTKVRAYAQMGIPYYVVHDPYKLLGKQELYAFELRGRSYVPMSEVWFPEIGLGLRLWEGEYEGDWATWLRWCDIDGELIPTGAELAAQIREQAEYARRRADKAEDEAEQAVEDAEEQRKRAEQAEGRAEQAEGRAEQAEERAGRAEERAERLAARLRALGLDPNAGG